MAAMFRFLRHLATAPTSVLASCERSARERKLGEPLGESLKAVSIRRKKQSSDRVHD